MLPRVELGVTSARGHSIRLTALKVRHRSLTSSRMLPPLVMIITTAAMLRLLEVLPPLVLALMASMSTTRTAHQPVMQLLLPPLPRTSATQLHHQL